MLATSVGRQRWRALSPCPPAPTSSKLRDKLGTLRIRESVTSTLEGADLFNFSTKVRYLWMQTPGGRRLGAIPVSPLLCGFSYIWILALIYVLPEKLLFPTRYRFPPPLFRSDLTNSKTMLTLTFVCYGPTL